MNAQMTCTAVCAQAIIQINTLYILSKLCIIILT